MTTAYAVPDLEIATHIAYGIPIDVEREIDVMSWPYQLPEVLPTSRVDLRSMASDVLALTGWSHRQLAAALGTTHPTVRTILDGQAEGWVFRNLDYRSRLRRMHAVIERMSLLVGRDPEQLRELLARPGPSGSAIDHMAAGRFDDAYLAAIETRRGPRAGRLLTGQHPRRIGESRVALDDDR